MQRANALSRLRPELPTHVNEKIKAPQCRTNCSSNCDSNQRFPNELNNTTEMFDN